MVAWSLGGKGRRVKISLALQTLDLVLRKHPHDLQCLLELMIRDGAGRGFRVDVLGLRDQAQPAFEPRFKDTAFGPFPQASPAGLTCISTWNVRPRSSSALMSRTESLFPSNCAS